MNKKRNVVKYLVKLENLDDNTISSLLDIGTVEIVSIVMNIVTVTTFTDADNKDKIEKCRNVIKVKEDTEGFLDFD